MEFINQDMLIEILSHIPLRDKIHSSKVCKKWYHLNKYIYQNQSIEIDNLNLDIIKFNKWSKNHNITYKIIYTGDLINLIEMIDVTKVVELDLTKNDYTTLPQELALFKNLKILHLGYNRFETIPDSVFDLKNLIKLDMFCNQIQIKCIPKEISQLTKLEILELDGNAIEKLPDSIGELKNLKRLNLGANLISQLPNSIGQLENLEYLDVIFNRLSSLPKTMINMKKLRVVCIDFNAFESIPKHFRDIVSISKHIEYV